MIEQRLEADVLVAGGGSAGTSAALAAARSGATVALVNGRPVLGGNSGSEVRLRMVGACGGRSGAAGENAMSLECREGGIVEEYQVQRGRDSLLN
jgi:glycine/D-amino acid oxidase-like deaminating enzyme